MLAVFSWFETEIWYPWPTVPIESDQACQTYKMIKSVHTCFIARSLFMLIVIAGRPVDTIYV